MISTTVAFRPDLVGFVGWGLLVERGGNDPHGSLVYVVITPDHLGRHPAEICLRSFEWNQWIAQGTANRMMAKIVATDFDLRDGQ
jgi:hypothetical protein